MVSLSRRRLSLVLLLAAACGGGQLRTADLYGTWQLVELGGESPGPHVMGEVLQLSPDGARYEGTGIPARRVAFEGHTGRIEFPGPGQPDQGLLVHFEGEETEFEAQMPNRSTLALVPNGIYGPLLTYRRIR